MAREKLWICNLDELEANSSRGVAVPDSRQRYFVIRTGSGIAAYVDRCPHTGAPLEWKAHQFLDHSGEFIQCAMHGALFDKSTGECLRGPCVGEFLQPAEVVQVNQDVFLVIDRQLNDG